VANFSREKIGANRKLCRQELPTMSEKCRDAAISNFNAHLADIGIAAAYALATRHALLGLSLRQIGNLLTVAAVSSYT
jgi:hypothetical protein